MRDELFFHFLMNERGKSRKPASDDRSRCRRVERELKRVRGPKFNLDSQYSEDKCESVIDFLEYGNRAAFSELDLPQTPEGLRSLQSAVRNYVRFCDIHAPETEL